MEDGFRKFHIRLANFPARHAVIVHGEEVGWDTRRQAEQSRKETFPDGVVEECSC